MRPPARRGGAASCTRWRHDWFMMNKHLLFPAKFDESGGYHPLLCHMLDVAAVAERIWCDVLSSAERDRIADELGVDADGTARWVSFVAGLHDLGKASPAFLAYPPAVDLRTRLAGLGLQAGARAVRPADAPHGQVTALELPGLLEQRFSISRELAEQLARLTGGHHGQFATRYQLDSVRSAAYGDGLPWREARRDLFDGLADALGVRHEDAPRAETLSNWAGMFLAGFVSVADWIGSNMTYYPYAATSAGASLTPWHAGEYARNTQVQARTALAALLWRTPAAPAARSFEDLFGAGRNPRPMQASVEALIERIRAPALVIVEAPTGEGKTEAALLVAHALARRGGTRGCYVALPTQATSNQLYGRVRDYVGRAYRDESVLLQLLHGHAALSAEFERALRRAAASSDLFRVGNDGEATVAASEWFTYRKRGLLAPFGVGTVDQALLAALRTRHVFVRLFGLAAKTVVIDEVHAYDVYMSSLIERLLEWLAALGSSVVLLSATLPRGRARRLVEAYARGLREDHGVRVEAAAYPRVTWMESGGQAGCERIRTSNVSARRIALKKIPTSTDDSGLHGVEELLEEMLADGGCAAVICNTVRRAQDVYRALAPRFSGRAEDGLPQLDLLHARLPFEGREEREQRCLARFGPRGARPARAVLIGTQVIEQSLDLDFDLMISDVAPIDLVLQRAGRLHRHVRERPHLLSRPALALCWPADSHDGVPTFSGSDTSVYDAHVLLRTWLALQPRDVIVTPDDVEMLIEAVYEEVPHAVSDLPQALAALWQKTQADLQAKHDAYEQEARDRALPPPWYDGDLARFTAWPGEEDAPDTHPAHQALTRLGDPSIDVVCLIESGGRATLADGTPVDPARTPTLDQARQILRRSLPVSQRGLAQDLIAQEPPAGWRKSALLRHHRMLLFTNGVCRIGRWELHLDPEIGLEVRQA